MTTMTLTFVPTRVRDSRSAESVATADILAFHRSLPGYAQTLLYSCPTLARHLGVAKVFVKDESIRLGLPSFKMLGASWATATAVSREWIGTTQPPRSIEWLIDGMTERYGADWRSGRRLVAATDGNHGRGVARMARLLGLRCQIFVPAGTARARIRAIAKEGARVDVVNGSYDDAISRSASEASEMSLVVSDTSWEGYTETPTNVIRGYSTMFAEIDQQLGLIRPTVVALQSGVGAFAAAGIAHWASKKSPTHPLFVIVEPTAANCLMLSAKADSITLAPGPHESMMAGLNCGLPSLIAWPLIDGFADAFVAIDDDVTGEAMRLMADCGIVAGESGAAGLAGLMAVNHGADREKFGLNADATVVLINTEWATDPRNFRRIVGRSAKGVMRTQRRRQQRTGTVLVTG